MLAYSSYNKSPLTICFPIASRWPNPTLGCTKSVVILVAANVDLIWAIHVSDTRMYIDVSVVGVVKESAFLPVSPKRALVTLVEGSRNRCRSPVTSTDTVILRPHVQTAARPWVAGIAFPHRYLFGKCSREYGGFIAGQWCGIRIDANGKDGGKDGQKGREVHY